MSGPTALDRLVAGAPALAEAASRLGAGEGGGRVALARPAWPYALAALARTSGRALLAVAPGDDEARDLADELIALLGRAAVALWPTRGLPVGGAVGPSPHIVGQRARALAGLERPGTVVVAGAPALAERVPAAASRGAPLEVAEGDRVSLEDLVDRLAAMGYERVPQVEERGELSVRGGILDVYPSTADLPVRVELFGDEVEGMRAFSAFTQRTIRPVARLVAWPAAEPAEGPWVDPLADPGPGDARVVRLAPAEHAAALREARERLEDEAAAGELAEPASVDEALAALSALDLPTPSGAATPAFDAVEARFASRSAAEAEAELGRLARGGLRVLVTFARRGDLARALARMERLRPAELAPGELPEPGRVAMTTLPARGGFVSRELGLAVVPEERVLRRRRPSEGRGPVVGRRLASFLDLRVGDHVVHEDHGIGRLTGVRDPHRRGPHPRLPRAGLRRRRPAVRPPRPARPRDPLRRRRRLPARALQAGRPGLGPHEVARPGRRAGDGRRADLALPGARRGRRARLPARRRADARAGAPLPAPGDAGPAAGHRRRRRRHGAPAPDGPPDLRRRRLRQDRDRDAGGLQGGGRRQAGADAGAHHDPGPAAPRDLPRALRRPAGDRRHGQPLPLAGGDARGAGPLPRRPPRRPHRHPPAAVDGRAAQGPRPGDRGRGAALRRGPEGGAAPAAAARGRPRHERDADPADAADLAVRASATSAWSRRRRPAGGRSRPTSASTTRPRCATPCGASTSAAARASTSTTGSRRSRRRPRGSAPSCPSCGSPPPTGRCTSTSSRT